MYYLKYADEYRKQFAKLNQDLQKRTSNALERIRIRPHSHVKKLIGNEYFSLRVGDHRVILDIKNDELIILAVTIGHRRNIYLQLN